MSSITFSKDIKTNLESLGERTLEYNQLIETVISLLGLLLEDERRRRDAIINIVIDYYKVKEGGTYTIRY